VRNFILRSRVVICVFDAESILEVNFRWPVLDVVLRPSNHFKLRCAV
jgi:hypothetical protein